MSMTNGADRSSDIGNASNVEDMLREHELELIHRSRWIFDLYAYSELPVLICGTIGHCLSLLVLFTSRNMQTTSFLYHKALTIAELVYCMNCFVQMGVDKSFAIREMEQTYKTYWSAFYSGTISRIFSSVTGYVIMYMMLLIACDRLLALHLKNHYRSVNRRKVAYSSILLSIFIGSVINSWSTTVDNVITERQRMVFPENATEYDDTVEPTMETVFRFVPRTSPNLYIQVRDAKNFYNGAIRIAYPIILLILTIVVICGFISQRRRRRLLSKRGRQTRRDMNLFYMLIMMVLLVFVQVIPTEAKRILEVVSPIAELKKFIANTQMPLVERVAKMDLMIMGHIWGKLIANLCTFLNRSLSFYLYFCFNRSFRAEVFGLGKLLKPRRESDTSELLSIAYWTK